MTRASTLAAWAAHPGVAFCVTVLLAAIVAVATLTPSENLPSAPGSDKLHHFLAFGAIAFPMALARPRAFLWIVLAVSAYGGGIEIVQSHVGRHGNIMDALANAIGAFCGAGLGVVVRNLFLRRNRTNHDGHV